MSDSESPVPSPVSFCSSQLCWSENPIYRIVQITIVHVGHILKTSFKKEKAWNIFEIFLLSFKVSFMNYGLNAQGIYWR